MNTRDYPIPGNIKVTASDSLNLMTPYVLEEQKDWFEDEINFIRKFIKPGMHILDIGANHGVYTLTMAALTGESGKVWSFEPCAETAQCLRESIRKNRSQNVELLQVGLSNRCGEAKFYTHPNSELNSLSLDENQHGGSETVQLLTLDHCYEKFKSHSIDFIKLDAEGEEENIIKGGARFFSSCSPVIMFEFKDGNKINLSLLQSFQDLDYYFYRLIPSLNVLIPFDPQKPFDEYLLNLFCCKGDMASRLIEDKIIIPEESGVQEIEHDLWQAYILSLPYAGHIAGINGEYSDLSSRYLSILNNYIFSIAEIADIRERTSALLHAMEMVRIECAEEKHILSQSVTMARIAFAAGERMFGVKILQPLIEQNYYVLNFEVQMPFLPASQRFDGLDPGGNINEWLFSSVLDEYVRKSSFSTYYSREGARLVLDRLSGLGFMSDDMARRKVLVN